MKYGQVWSAHWEGAVGEWLRGQLEARGIDAPAYGRYVLSLLTKPLDPADLNPSPVGNQLWERRTINNLAPLQVEALKRSAVIQCLVNATDDKNSGIEQLVDELCMKLKEAEAANNQSTKRGSQVSKISRKEKSKILSPSEMARLYYAAFPALVPTDEALATPITSTNQQPTKDTASRKNQSKEWLRSKHQQQQIQQQQQGTKERRNTFHVHRKQSRTAKKREKCKSHDRTEMLPEWITNEDVWDMDGQDPIKEFIKSTTADEGYGTCDNTTVEELASSKRLYERETDMAFNEDLNFYCNWDMYDNINMQRTYKTNDESIAKFEAKFDRSLEALWSKDQNNTPYDEYQDLPMDFQDLLSSPSDRMFEYSPRNKEFSSLLSNSIWSSSDNTINCSKETFQPLFTNSEHNLIDNVSDVAKNVWEKDDNFNKQNMEVIYNKLQPLNLDDTDAKSNEACGLWNNESSDKQLQNDLYTQKCYQDLINAVPAVTTNMRSLTALNHSRLYSSFIEVVPKAPSSGYVGMEWMERKNNNSYKFETSKPICSMYSERDDEDLLNSVRTHFQPINVQNSVQYTNGMTFTIDSELDDVHFYRSSSGAMFLETDTETPKQYMEYRKEGIDYSRLDLSSVCSDDDLSSNDLVLKFKVCQNEKSVQTESPVDENAIAESSPQVNETSNGYMNVDKCTVGSNADIELEHLQQNWIQCEDCRLNNNNWITDEWARHKINENRIWSIDDNSCKACTERKDKFIADTEKYTTVNINKEECAKEWEELFSDIICAQKLQDIESVLYNRSLSPDDRYIFTAPEISYKALDGNYIKSTQLRHPDSIEKLDKNVGLNNQRYTVSYILDRSLTMYTDVEPHCEACADDTNRISDSTGWKGDRKRRHSAAGGGSIACTGGSGKLRCTLAAPPPALRPLHVRLLSTAERPLTR